MGRQWQGTLALVGALAFALVSSLTAAARKPRTVVFGSNLAASPQALVPGGFAADAEFWNVALAGKRRVKAPRAGRITAIKLKTGDDSEAVSLRISIIRRQHNGTFRVVTTSTPHWTLPAHSAGIHTFSTAHLAFKMPLKRGDLVALDTPGVKTEAMKWWGAVPGSAADHYSAHGGTQNQGATWTGSRHPGVELLLQVVER